MGNKFIWFGVLAFVLAGAAALYIFVPNNLQNITEVVCTMEAKICPDGSAVGRSGPSCEFSVCPTPTFKWIVSEAGEDARGTPHTNLSVAVGGREYQAGAYAGSCIEIQTLEWEFVPGELSGVLCGFAGGGIEIGVFQTGESLLLRKGLFNAGTAKTPGTRGPFETILKIGQSL